MEFNKTLRENHEKRIEEGTKRTYANGNEYLCSPSFGPVEVGAYRSFLKANGFKNLEKLV